MRKKLYYFNYPYSLECNCDPVNNVHRVCPFSINVSETQTLDPEGIKRVMTNAYSLMEEHLINEHNDKCYDCNSCDKKFMKIKDVIKKNHNCSYKKTKLKKRLEKHFYPDISNLILGFIE